MKKLLLIVSTLSQLVAMKELSENLNEYQCWYRPIYMDTSFFKVKRTWVSLIGHKVRHRKQDVLLKEYCSMHHLRIDGDEPNAAYDLAISYYNEPVTENFPHVATVCIEELESLDNLKIVVQSFKSLWFYFRRFYRNSSYRFDVYCVNSEHKKMQLNQSGISEDKILVIKKEYWASEIGNICRNLLELALVSQKSHQLLKKARIDYLLGLYP